VSPFDCWKPLPLGVTRVEGVSGRYPRHPPTKSWLKRDLVSFVHPLELT